MKMKRTICLILSIMIVLSVLAGCQAEPDVSTDPPESRTPTQTQEPNSQGTTASHTPGLNAEEHSEIYEKIHSILKDSEFYFMDETDALVPYYEMAAERKEAILNSPTEIVKADEFIPGETYTGTAYYVSPNGNDDNDGLSLETAWKTAGRIGWGDVQEGDAVFFERGGIYRLTEGSIRAVSNVTYSAYGEGAKPIITLTQENSARTECWELYYEGADGEKIWRYYQQTGDVCGIVLDDEAYAKRVLEWPTPEGWLALDIQVMDPANGIIAPEDPCGKYQVASANEYRTVEEQLINDLTYICRVDISNLTYPVDFREEYRTGNLYLRCDEGNPGECFEGIAVIAQQQTQHGDIYSTLVDGAHADGWVLDNLSMKHYGSSGIFSYLQSSQNSVIQNCTVEWGGNLLCQFESEKPTNGFCLVGDGIYCFANNVTIRNNYLRQGGNGFTFEGNWEDIDHLGSYIAEGNLIENCGQGIRTYFISPEYERTYDEIILRDNIILDTGNGLNNACWEEPVAIDLGHEPVQYAKRIEVSNNIMIGSTLAMFRIPDSTGIDLDIHDNVIAQSRDGALITECAWLTSGGVVWHMMEDAK